MIVLDTNVLSEEMRATPDPKVHAWLAAQIPAQLYTTSICEAEMLYGIAALSDGRRKRNLETAAGCIMALFSGRILPFDSAAAAELASVVITRKRLGLPVASHDALIIAIARSRGMAIATRDIAGFEGCGVKLINPWEA